MRTLLLCSAVLLPFAARAATTFPVPLRSASVPAGAIDVLAVLPQADASTDYTTVINQALAQGRTLFFRATGTPYRYTPPIILGAHSALVGQPGVVLAAYGTAKVQTFSVPAGATGASIDGITFDGTHAAQDPAICRAAGFRMRGGGMTHTNALILGQGCDGAVVQDGKYSWSSSVAIAINGGNHDAVLHNQIETPKVFAIDAGAGSGFFRVDDNWTTTYTGAEFFAAFVESHDGEVGNNSSVNAGDNGMSFSGTNIRATNNRISHALSASIAIYGDRNTITGNRLVDGGQVLNPHARPLTFCDGSTKAVFHSPGYSTGPQPALNLVGAFGGYAQLNTLRDNTVDDDQPVPTQAGLYVGAGQRPWNAGSYSHSAYVYVNGSTWKTRVAGTSTVAPSGRTDFADPHGTAVWQWVSVPSLGQQGPAGNRIGPNRIGRTASYRFRSSIPDSANIFTGPHP